MKKQAGCVVVRIGADDGIEVLLVTSRKARQKGKLRWVFPKGSVKSRETSQQAAERETEEEAGVTGRVVGHLGTYPRDPDPPIDLYVLFALHMTESFSEEGQRERRWWRLSEAQNQPMDPYVSQALKDLQENESGLPLRP
eukprot:TRINITY_DN14384_c0_g1_i1.p1 TRINITY_DN14384_c0_g1~~TRINITY_DN14384_c0_g1_i1.p1  ORF type:complete len:140 (-),score=28.62 TRINITY_DN14384_c0_g1_i1:40-459(-)